MNQVVNPSDAKSLEVLRKQHLKLLSFLVSVINQGGAVRDPLQNTLVENKHLLEVVGGVVWNKLGPEQIDPINNLYLESVAAKTDISSDALRFVYSNERQWLGEIKKSLDDLKNSKDCLTYYKLFELNKVYNQFAKALDHHRNDYASKILKLSEEAPSPTTWAVASTRTTRQVRGELRLAKETHAAIAVVMKMVNAANEECLRVMSQVPSSENNLFSRGLPEQFERIQNEGSILHRISIFMSGQFLLRAARNIQISLAGLSQDVYHFGSYINEFNAKKLDLPDQRYILKRFGISFPLRRLLNLEGDLNSGAVVSLGRLQEDAKLAATYIEYLDGLENALKEDGKTNKWFLRVADKIGTIKHRVGKLEQNIQSLLVEHQASQR